jgi:hypothetical protein
MEFLIMSFGRFLTFKGAFCDIRFLFGLDGINFDAFS